MRNRLLIIAYTHTLRYDDADDADADADLCSIVDDGVGVFVTVHTILSPQVKSDFDPDCLSPHPTYL